MSTLTLTLILLVAATLAAVAIVNLLQARRNRTLGRPSPRGAAGAGGAHGDMARGEPSLALDEAGGPVADGGRGAAAPLERSSLGGHGFDPEPTAAEEGTDRFDPRFETLPEEPADGPGRQRIAAGTVARHAATGGGDAGRHSDADPSPTVPPPEGIARRPDPHRPTQPAAPAPAADSSGSGAPTATRETPAAGTATSRDHTVTPGHTAATATAADHAAATTAAASAHAAATVAASTHAAGPSASSGPAGTAPAASGPAGMPAAAHGHAVEPETLAANDVSPADPRSSARRLPDRPALGELSDCIIEVPLQAPQSGERLLTQTQPLRRVGAKPILFEGLLRGASGDDGSGWAPLAAGQQYRSLRAGVLMANRHGPLNAMEFSEFIAGVNGLASQLGVTTRNPDMTPVLERARELDSLCIQLDAQVGVNVDCAQPLIPADLARMAVEQNLVERGNNRYARLNAAGQVLFSVSLADEPNRLTFLLDVPRAPAADEPWRQLVEAAQAIAARLQGALVDDGARPLAAPSLARIGQQLAQRYESLEQAGFPAGSALALRLFN